MTNCQLTLPEHDKTSIKSDQFLIYTQTNGGAIDLIAQTLNIVDGSGIDAGTGNIHLARIVDTNPSLGSAPAAAEITIINQVFDVFLAANDFQAFRSSGTTTVGQATFFGPDGVLDAAPLTVPALTVNAPIQTSGTNLALISGGVVDVNADISTQLGALDINAGGIIDSEGVLNGGDVTLTSNDSIVLNGNPNSVVGRSITIDTPGALSVAGALNARRDGPANAGDVTIGNSFVPSSIIVAAISTRNLAGGGGGNINITTAGSLIATRADSRDPGGPVDPSNPSNNPNDIFSIASEADADGGAINIVAHGGITTAAGIFANSRSSRNWGSINLISGNGAISIGALNAGSVSGNTNGDGFSVNGDTLLTSDSSISTGGGGITFNGLIDSAVDEGDPAVLTLNSGDGAIALGDVGSNSRLGGLTATGGSISLQDVITQGEQTYTSAGLVTFNSSYSTSGGDFLVAGNASLGSDTSVDTDGGIIRFERALNGGNALRLADSGDIFFGGDVGTSSRLGPVTIDGAGNITIRERFVAGDTRFRYSGNATSPVDSLNLTSLFLLSSAQGATLFGTVDGASGEDAALVVQGPFGDPDFTINNCVIGVACGQPVVLPPQVDPIPPKKQVGLFGTTPSRTEARSLWAVYKRHPPSEDPTEPQYSNFGNEELWD